MPPRSDEGDAAVAPNLSLFHRLRRRFRLTAAKFMRSRNDPHSIGIGFACGVYVCWTPLLGLHVLMALLLTRLLRGNYTAAVVGTFWGNPLSFPPMWWLSHRVGEWLLPGYADASAIDFATQIGNALKSGDPIRVLLNAFLLDWVVVVTAGGLVVGALGFPLFYALGQTSFERYRRLKRKRDALRRSEARRP